MPGLDRVKRIVKVLDAMKAVDIEVVEIGDLTIIADYFVIATGTSSTQVKSLANEVEYRLSQQGIEPHHTEGRSTGWVLLDYGTVVVHIFYGETREFYALERLWTDGHRLDVEALLTEAGGEKNEV